MNQSKGGDAVEDTLKELLGDFVLIAATIDYGGKLIRWLIRQLMKLAKKHESPRKRRLK